MSKSLDPTNDQSKSEFTDSGSNHVAVTLFLFIVNLMMIVSIFAGILLIQGKNLPPLFFQALGLSSVGIVVISVLSNKGKLGNYFLNTSIFASSLLLTLEGFGFNSELNYPLIAFSVVSVGIFARLFLLDKLLESLIKGMWSAFRVLGRSLLHFVQQIPNHVKRVATKYWKFILRDPLTALEYHLFGMGVMLLIIEILPIPQVLPINYWILAILFIVLAFLRDAYVLSPQIVARVSKALRAFFGWISNDPTILLVLIGLILLISVPFLENNVRVPVFAISILFIFSFNRFAFYRTGADMFVRLTKGIGEIIIQVSSVIYRYNFIPSILGFGLVSNWRLVPEDLQIAAIVVGTFLMISFNQFWLVDAFDRLYFLFITISSFSFRSFRFFLRHFVNLKTVRAGLGMFNGFLYFIFVFIADVIPWWLALILSMISFSLAFDGTTRVLINFLQRVYHGLQNQKFLAYMFGYLFLFMAIFNFWIPPFPYARLLIAVVGLILLSTVSKFFRFWTYTLPKNIAKSIYDNVGGIGRWLVNLIEAIISNIFVVLSFFLGIAGIIFGLALLLSGVLGLSWVENLIPNLPELQTIILGGMMIAFGVLIPRYTYARREELRLTGIDIGGPKQ